MNLAVVASCLIAVLACFTDLRSRRIPNALTLGGAAVGVGVHVMAGGVSGAGTAMAGWIVGLLLFLPLFAMRGIGGGDVKLLAALGACLGPVAAFWLACWSAVAGGVFALVVARTNGYTGQAFRNVWAMLGYWRVMGLQPHPTVALDKGAGPRLPYSLPIAAGLGVTLWLR